MQAFDRYVHLTRGPMIRCIEVGRNVRHMPDEISPGSSGWSLEGWAAAIRGTSDAARDRGTTAACALTKANDMSNEGRPDDESAQRQALAVFTWKEGLIGRYARQPGTKTEIFIDGVIWGCR